VRPVPPTGHWHDDYERGRPGWPAQAPAVAGVPASATVLELGAGTGKLTRLLVTRFDRVIAVEPDEGMRRLLVSLCAEADVHAGSAEAIPVADESVDAVFAAEAFHWFDGERALAEVARVLRPRGALILMWNVPAGPTEPSITQVEQLLIELAPAELGHDPVDLNATRFASGEWRAPFASSPFDELRQARLPNPQVLDREALVAFFESMGWIGDLPDAQRLSLLDRVRSMLDADVYRRSWETHVYWTRLRRVGGSGGGVDDLAHRGGQDLRFVSYERGGRDTDSRR
jgi:SAM-dependent methyltransferase